MQNAEFWLVYLDCLVATGEPCLEVAETMTRYCSTSERAWERRCGLVLQGEPDRDRKETVFKHALRQCPFHHSVGVCCLTASSLLAKDHNLALATLCRLNRIRVASR